MRRRQVLASCGSLLAVTVAGCGHPPVVLDMDGATADDIADEVSMAADPGSEEYTLVTSARENGSATRTGRTELFDRIDTVRADDTFYEVSETRLESNDVTVYEVLVDIDPENSTPELGEIAYDDLPEADRNRLERIVSEEDQPGQSEYDIGVEYGTADEVGNDSVFVPERQYDIVRRDEDRYRIAVHSRTATEATYRYEVTEIAPDVAAFAARIRERYLFALADLSDAERAVVEKAIDEGYFEDDDAFRSVIDRIRDHDGLDVTGTYGTWLVEYEGDEYVTYAEW
ncbi:hypothetical protein [Halopiger xanaduensis]|uniref:Uncharacterized protein n=1 Tax=Halopiger xanaduensis (strain DSM 18323 / JCM 14033 / SH-6) TaxID=797210 RepID=F8DDM6_HALXS|nr:hypothetical protein [Halopiger xanaduensis]AEH39128.1 hypothetical protein Halxa_0529 [Halopiger xanaduensis SH-6]